MAPKPDWKFLGGFASKASLEDDEADEVLDELRDVDVENVTNDKHLRLAFKLAKAVMTVKAAVFILLFSYISFFWLLQRKRKSIF